MPSSKQRLPLLVCTACLCLSGCSMMGSIMPEGDTPEMQDAHAALYGVGFQKSKSFAWNMLTVAEGGLYSYVGIEQDPNWKTQEQRLQNTKFFRYYMAKDGRPTSSYGFVKDEDLEAEKNKREPESHLSAMASTSRMSGHVKTGLALDVADLFFGRSETSTDGSQSWLTDQFIIFIPQSQFEEPLDAENYLYRQLTEAFTAAVQESRLKSVKVSLIRGCERSRLLVKNTQTNEDLVSLYLRRIKKGIDPEVAGCDSSLFDYLLAHNTADIPAWLNRGQTQKAWFFSRFGNNHLFLTGNGIDLAIRAIRHLPPFFYLYIAPRHQNLKIVSKGMLYDNQSVHPLRKPKNSEKPTW